MQGYTTLERPVTRAKIDHEISKREKRREFLRGRVERREDGSYVATSFKNQSSALIGTMHQANCLLVIPEGPQQIAAGDEVCCLRLDIAEGVQ
jgi:molybdopterin molybdotransferase